MHDDFLTSEGESPNKEQTVKQQILNGSCLCGNVKLRIRAEFIKVGYCHCSECQKFSGSAFSAFGVVKEHHFKILTDKTDIKYFAKSKLSELAFCQNCGSSLFVRKTGKERINIRLGILVDDLKQKPDFHVNINSKANWFEIADSLKTFK